MTLEQVFLSFVSAHKLEDNMTLEQVVSQFRICTHT
jgi:hypothetical protein